MTNDFSDHSNFFSRSIVSAFSTATTANDANQRYVHARHHHIEKPRHGLDYHRVHMNTRPRDDGRAPMMVPA